MLTVEASSFGVANEFNGLCNLRLDDTNPVAEKIEYANAIKDDVKWLGFNWGERLYHASDYFDQLFEFATQLIQSGKAFVCDLGFEEMKELRGTLVTPGQNSPFSLIADMSLQKVCKSKHLFKLQNELRTFSVIKAIIEFNIMPNPEKSRIRHFTK